MKRLKTLASCGIAVACMAALLACMTGCSSQQTYTPPEATPTLSAPTIGQDGVLRVGVNTQNAPLSGQPSSSTKIVGIDVDVAAALADSFGLKLEVVDVGSDPESALSAGTVDLVMGIDKTDTSLSFWTSDAYLPTAVALFSAPGNASVPTNASQPSIAAQVSSKSAWAVTNEFDQAAITTTDDLKSAFSSLESGQVQYVAADAIIGTYAAHSSGNDVQIVALMQQPSGYAVGVLSGNTELQMAVSNALVTLEGNGMIAVIETKWLGTALNLASTPLTAGATASGSAVASTGDGAAPADEGADAATAEGEGSDAPSGEGEGADAPAGEDGSSDVANNAGENAVQPEDVAV